jgi:hypothetical protein
MTQARERQQFSLLPDLCLSRLLFTVVSGLQEYYSTGLYRTILLRGQLLPFLTEEEFTIVKFVGMYSTFYFLHT